MKLVPNHPRAARRRSCRQEVGPPDSGRQCRIVPLRDLAQVDVAQHLTGQLELSGAMPLMLTTGTTPPITVGNCTRPSLASCSSFSGMSDAPKSTVLARIWFSPRPSRPTGSSDVPRSPCCRRRPTWRKAAGNVGACAGHFLGRGRSCRLATSGAASALRNIESHGEPFSSGELRCQTLGRAYDSTVSAPAAEGGHAPVTRAFTDVSQNGPLGLKGGRRLLPRPEAPDREPGQAQRESPNQATTIQKPCLSSASRMPPTFMPSRPARVDQQREHRHHGQDEQTAAVASATRADASSCSNLMRSCSAPMSRSTTAKSSLDCTKRCASSPDSQSGGLAMTRLSAPGSGASRRCRRTPEQAQPRRARPRGARRGGEQRVLDVVHPLAGGPRDALQLVGLVAQQMVETAHGRADRLATLHRGAQAVDRAQRMAPRADHGPARMSTHSVCHVAGIEGEVERDVVDHGPQRLALAFDAGRSQPARESRRTPRRVRCAPSSRFGGSVRGVEVQPDEALAVACRLLAKPACCRLGVDRRSWPARFEQPAADQPWASDPYEPISVVRWRCHRGAKCGTVGMTGRVTRLSQPRNNQKVCFHEAVHAGAESAMN